MSEPPISLRRRSVDPPGLVDSGAPVLAIVALFMVIDRIVRTTADLGASGYQQPVLIAELVRQHLIVGVLGVLIIATVGWKARSFGPVWPSFERGWSLRLPLGSIVVVLTWTYACYDYNLWADQLHAFDRAALIVIAGLTLWRPIFLAPWIVVVSMIAFQFRYPIGVDQLAETFQLVRVAELFVAVIVLRLFTSRWFASSFLFVSIALLASGYWVSGVGKLRLGWFAVGPHLDSLFFATHANGWLGFLSADAASALGRSIQPLLWPMLIIGALVELGAPAILWGRRTLHMWLVAFIGFHLGVFALTGIFFWKWIVFELALLAFLRRDRLIDQLQFFGLPQAAMGTALILLGPLWARPIDLSWLDSPVNYVYRFDATMSDGTRRELTPTFFRPHDYVFTLSPFGYLSHEPRLPIVWGATRSRDQLEVLYEADGPAAIFEAEEAYGVVGFDPDRAASFDAFLVRFAGNWNRRHSRSSGFSIIGPPPQLWTSSGDVGDANIERITVWQVTTYWDGDDYDEIRSVNVREIEIAASEPTGSP